MATETSAPRRTAPPTHDLGIDRAFVFQMARMPALAALWVAAAVLADRAWAAATPAVPNLGPVVVICLGMILAAAVDGWAYKVPNWATLPLVLSGWMLGGLHDLGVPADAGAGGFGAAVLGTAVGFGLLFPLLAVGGVGVGDVKMQMGFGAWAGAYFGAGGPGTPSGPGVVVAAFCAAAVVGGLFGLVMIVLRGRFRENARTVAEIMVDLRLFAGGQAGLAARRAKERRSRWVKLPYGVPLCVGFLLYLWYALVLTA
ncbi:MAG: prepilin peptidase [Gemmataceae bacterium]|nr:prepilin peptidase [Gemmataceae bacterium]